MLVETRSFCFMFIVDTADHVHTQLCFPQYRISQQVKHIEYKISYLLTHCECSMLCPKYSNPLLRHVSLTNLQLTINRVPTVIHCTDWNV